MADNEEECPSGVAHKDKAEWLSHHPKETKFLQRIHDRVQQGVSMCESPGCDQPGPGLGVKGLHHAGWAVRLQPSMKVDMKKVMKETKIDQVVDGTPALLAKMLSEDGVALCGCCLAKVFLLQELEPPMKMLLKMAPIVYQPIFDSTALEEQMTDGYCIHMARKAANALHSHRTHGPDIVAMGSINGAQAKEIEEAVRSGDKEAVARIIGPLIAEAMVKAAGNVSRGKNPFPALEKNDILDMHDLMKDDKFKLPESITKMPRQDN